MTPPYDPRTPINPQTNPPCHPGSAMTPQTNPPPYQGRLLIDGRWCDAADARRLERRSPAHGQLVAVYAEAGVPDAQRAIGAARQAFDKGPWPLLKGAERARILRH